MLNYFARIFNVTFPSPKAPKETRLLQGAAKTCSKEVVRSPSIFHLCFMCLKKSFCTQISVSKKKRRKSCGVKIFLIPLRKGENLMSFCANASFPLISSYSFYLLSLCLPLIFHPLVKDTEGRGAPLPACDLGRLSQGSKIVCGENKPASADGEEDTIRSRCHLTSTPIEIALVHLHTLAPR